MGDMSQNVTQSSLVASDILSEMISVFKLSSSPCPGEKAIPKCVSETTNVTPSFRTQ
jgi:hypothetical protein